MPISKPGESATGGLGRATWMVLWTTVLVLIGCSLVFYDLTHSNRPHELKNAPYATVVFALAALLLVPAIRRLWRALRTPAGDRGRALVYLLAAYTLALTAFDLFLLIAAASTVPAVLFAS